MAEEAAAQEYRLKAGGVVAVRRRQDKAAVRRAFSAHVIVAESAREVAWTSQPPLTLVIEERGMAGQAVVYEFETTKAGLKLFAEVVAAIVLDAGMASSEGNGEAGGGGSPPVSVLDIRLPAKTDEKRPMPPVWHRQKAKS